MTKTLCKIFGVVLLLVGIAGFVSPRLLGMHLTPVHNVVHLLTAAIALYLGFAGSWSAARTFCIAFGAIYLLLAVVGFIAPGVVAGIIGAGHDMGGSAGTLTSSSPDHIVHLLLGVVFLGVGLMRSTQTAATT